MTILLGILPSKTFAAEADIGDARLYYERAGKGEAVILIHAHSVDSRMWDAQFAELAKHYDVIRYDMRGYGRSSLPEEGKDFSHDQDLLRLMEVLGVKKAHLVGLSLGSWVVLDFLARYPDKALTVSVASGGLHDPQNWKSETVEERTLRLKQVHDDKLRSIAEVKEEGVEAYKKAWLEILLKMCGPQRETIRPALGKMVEDWSVWQPLHLEPAEGSTRPGSGERLPTTTELLVTQKPVKPALVLIGQEDNAGSRGASEALLKILPSAKKVVLPGAGHFSNMETAEAFNRVLLNFLQFQK